MSVCCICENDDNELIELSCDHEFCKVCLVDYITFKMDDGDNSYKCPSCHVKITRLEITDLENSELLKRYDEIFRFDISNFAVCAYCKTKCKKDPNSHHIDCPDCKWDFCYICGTDDHRKYRHCPNERKIERDANELTKELENLGLDTKPCPLCKAVIEREEGCNSMKCTYCKLKFCWSCLKSCSEINRMDDHQCDEYGTFRKTDSDDEYISGSDIDV